MYFNPVGFCADMRRRHWDAFQTFRRPQRYTLWWRQRRRGFFSNFRKTCKICQQFKGSFSAVSKPIFASKRAFCSIFQFLQDLLAFAQLRTQHFSIFANFGDFCRCMFLKICWKSTEIADFSVNFFRNFIGISGNCRQLPEVAPFF